MSSELRKLLEWNHRIVLGDLLATETHLAVLGREYIKDSWCIKKHLTHALEHGVKEAISHSEALGLDSSKYREFYKKLEALLEKPEITITDVRRLRDEWRFITGDKTLTSECPICKLDIGREILEKIQELTARIDREIEEIKKGEIETTETLYFEKEVKGEKTNWKVVAAVGVVSLVLAGISIFFVSRKKI